MHDKNGKEIKVGDFVKFTEGEDVHIGKVETLYPGSTSCNIVVSHVIHAPTIRAASQTASAVEIVHAKEYKDDVKADEKAAG